MVPPAVSLAPFGTAIGYLLINRTAPTFAYSAVIRIQTMLPTAKIGPYTLPNPLIVAPMAGVTDRPFRLLCRRMGAGLAVSEMVIADSKLWHTRKSRTRMDHAGEPEPRSVQIAGGDPDMLANAARLNAESGAQIIDINMGCPAKKSLQQSGWFSADERRASGTGHFGSGCQRSGHPRYAKNAYRLGSKLSQRPNHRPHG
jgi:hypothetical protein